MLVADPISTTPTKTGSNPITPKKSPNQMVRTDSKAQTLDAFVQTEHRPLDDMQSEENNNNNLPLTTAKNKLPPLKFPNMDKPNQQRINLDDDEDENENANRDFIDQLNKNLEMQKKRYIFFIFCHVQIYFTNFERNSCFFRPREDDSDFETSHQAKKISANHSDEDVETKAKKIETAVLYIRFISIFPSFPSSH